MRILIYPAFLTIFIILLSPAPGSAQAPPTQPSRELQTQIVEHPDLAHATELVDEGKYPDAIAELKELAEATSAGK